MEVLEGRAPLLGAGRQGFQCTWCQQTIFMPDFESLSTEHQIAYRNELKQQQEKAHRAAEKKQVS